MSAPHVSGLAALIWSRQPSLTNEQVRQLIRTGATDLAPLGKDASFGYGRINAAASVECSTVLRRRRSSPFHGAEYLLSGLVSVQGSAAGPGFARSTLEMGFGRSPSQWTLLSDSTTPVIQGTLGTLNSVNLAEGTYTLRLSVYDTSGRRFDFQVYDVAVDNVDSVIAAPKAAVYGTVVDVLGSARTLNGIAFGSYSLEYAEATAPNTWSSAGITLSAGGLQPVLNGRMAGWDTSVLKNDTEYTLRLTVRSGDGLHVETAQVSVRSDKDVVPGWPKQLPLSNFDGADPPRH